MERIEYRVDTYGLILDQTAINYMRTLFKVKDIRKLLQEIDLEIIANFTGASFPILDNGFTDYEHNTNYFDDNIFFVGIKQPLSLFSAPYANFNEIIEEVENRIGHYLPNEFDYRHNIHHIIGCYF